MRVGKGTMLMMALTARFVTLPVRLLCTSAMVDGKRGLLRLSGPSVILCSSMISIFRPLNDL